MNSLARFPRTVVPFVAAGALFALPAAANAADVDPVLHDGQPVLRVARLHARDQVRPAERRLRERRRRHRRDDARLGRVRHARRLDLLGADRRRDRQGRPERQRVRLPRRVLGRHGPARAVQRPRQVLRPLARQLLLGRRDARHARHAGHPRHAAGRPAARGPAAGRPAPGRPAARPTAASCPRRSRRARRA